MVEAIVRDKKRILPCSAWLQGEYGMEGLFLGVPCKLGRNGLEGIIEVRLTDEERAALGKSADAVRETMAAARLTDEHRVTHARGGALGIDGRQEDRHGGLRRDPHRLRRRRT
jgi:hypothetical protein